MPGKAGTGSTGRSAQVDGVGIWEERRQRDADGFVFSAGQKLMTAEDAKNGRL
jgi:hypothetical protein